jgi:hypothetical protein
MEIDDEYAYVATPAESREDTVMLTWFYTRRFHRMSGPMRFALADAIFGRGPPHSPPGMVPRNWMDASVVSDRQFKKAFRFQRIHFRTLLALLEVPDEFRVDSHRISMPGWLAFLALLYEVRRASAAIRTIAWVTVCVLVGVPVRCLRLSLRSVVFQRCLWLPPCRAQYSHGCTRAEVSLAFEVQEYRLNFFIPEVEQWLYDKYVVLMS